MTFFYKNTKINYSSNGKGTAVVLLHGFLENISMWDFIVEKLSKRNRVICIDLFGHGKSENFSYVHTMEEQSKMVKAVLDSLHLRRYFMVGHSMGGYISLSFAELFPKNLKGLCLMNSTALPDSKDKLRNRNKAIKTCKLNHKVFVRVAIPMLFSKKNRTINSEDIEEVTYQALKMTPQGIIAALEGLKIRKNMTSVYHNNNFQTILVIGKKDPLLEYQSLISQVKNTAGKVVELEGGHMSHIENKPDLEIVLKKFAGSKIITV